MTDLTVAELMTYMIDSAVEGKRTFVADSTGKMLILESGKYPQHVNLELLTAWIRK